MATQNGTAVMVGHGSLAPPPAKLWCLGKGTAAGAGKITIGALNCIGVAAALMEGEGLQMVDATGPSRVTYAPILIALAT